MLRYQWECTIPSFVVIGFVGAGDISQQLGISLRLFHYAELATLLIAVLVLVVDRISKVVRNRMGANTR